MRLFARDYLPRSAPPPAAPVLSAWWLHARTLLKARFFPKKLDGADLLYLRSVGRDPFPRSTPAPPPRPPHNGNVGLMNSAEASAALCAGHITAPHLQEAAIERITSLSELRAVKDSGQVSDSHVLWLLHLRINSISRKPLLG